MTIEVSMLSKIFNKLDPNRVRSRTADLLLAADCIPGDGPQKERDRMLRMVRTGLRRGINLEAKGTNGDTLLSILCRRGHGEPARLLIEQGADVNAKDGTGTTPLMLSAGAADPATMGALVKKGADVNALDNSGRNTAHFLLNFHLNPNSRARDEATIPKSRAVSCMWELMNGGLVLTPDQEKAIYRERTVFFSQAVRYIWDAMGLHDTCEQPEDPQNLAKLSEALGKGVHPDMPARFLDSTPLADAAARGSLGMIDALVQAKADVNLVSPKSGLTPLQSAALNGKKEAFEKLLLANAKPGTPVSSACRDYAGMSLPDLARASQVPGFADAVGTMLDQHTKSHMIPLELSQDVKVGGTLKFKLKAPNS